MNAAAEKPRCRLYLISPPDLDPGEFEGPLREALAAGDVASFQLRLKEAGERAIEEAARRFMPLCHEHGTAFILNDRADLAAALDCDGVHIGQEDTDYETARRLLGEERIVGVTCHNSRHLAMIAAEQGADYVAFGAFFPTETKTPKFTAEPEILDWWQELMEIPCVAIGGITVDNAATLIEAGADFLAVSGGVWNHPGGPGEAVRAFDELFQSVEA